MSIGATVLIGMLATSIATSGDAISSHFGQLDTETDSYFITEENVEDDTEEEIELGIKQLETLTKEKAEQTSELYEETLAKEAEYIAEQERLKAEEEERKRQEEAAAITGSEAEAKEWIAMHESGGDYNAMSPYGYVGRYQMSPQYFDGRYGGDGSYSPENQEIVANAYVAERYGSWRIAKSFWECNGFY